MKTNLIGFVFAGWLTFGGLALAQEVPSPPRTPDFMPGKSKPAVSPPLSADQLVRVTATADVAQIVPGQKFHLAFVFDIEPQWHIYWKNPGSAGGGPTDIKVTGPADFSIGKTLFTRPLAIEGEEGTSYGYEDKAVVYVEVTAPVEIMVSQATFSAKVNWMVCKDVCLMGRNAQMLTLPVGDPQVRRAFPPAKSDPAVAQFKSRLPRPIGEVSGAEARFDGQTLTVKLPAQGQSAAEFFPIEAPGVQLDPATIKAEEDWITVTVPVRVNPNNAMGKPMSVAGVIGLGNRQTDPSYEIDIALPAP